MSLKHDLFEVFECLSGGNTISQPNNEGVLVAFFLIEGRNYLCGLPRFSLVLSYNMVISQISGIGFPIDYWFIGFPIECMCSL